MNQPRKPERKPERSGRPTTNRDDTGVAARRAALKIVQAVLDRGAPFDAATSHADDLPLPQDRGLARLLALTVLRWLPELDELRNASSLGRQWIADLQNHEIERTGIKSLKIKYNAVKH
jgi:hypothetical protein